MQPKDTPQALTAPAMLAEIWKLIRPFRISFTVGTLLNALAVSLWLVIPWALGQLINYAAGEPNSGTSAWYWLGLIGGVAVLYFLCQEGARYLLYMVAEKGSVALQHKSLHHICRLDLAWHEQAGSGIKLKKISRGGASLNRFIRMYCDLGIDAVVSLLGISLVFASLSWQLNLILLAFLITHYFLSAWLTNRARAQSRRVNQVEEAFYARQFELFNAITTIKALGLTERLMNRVRAITDKLLVELRHRIYLFRSRMAILGLERQFFRLAIIGVSVWQVLEGHFAVGLIAQVYFYFSKIETTADRFSQMYHQWMLTRIDLEGIFDMLAQPAQIESQGEQLLAPDWQQLEMRDLRFRYQDRWVLNGLDLQVKRGEKIGLVGVSGAGKSTLVKLLLKLYADYDGYLGFDDVPLHQMARQPYVARLSVVMQDTELFNLSLRENLVLTSPEAVDEARLWHALEVAQLSDWVQRQPSGLDTLIGEKGLRLSGGEKQRLGIARAVYRQPELLILDEATAHLDGEAEKHMQAALAELFKDITALVIAHRLTTLRLMDRIVVLEAGKIVESGSFEALLQQQGVFYHMWQQQFWGNSE